MASSFFLITVLMLVMGAMKIAVARLETSRTASFDAFRTATTDEVPQFTGDSDLAPIDGVGSLRPGLPNRTHVRKTTQDVTVSAGYKQSIPAVKLGARAGTASPSWTFSAYPVGGQDQLDTEDWFVDYGAESHTWLTDPLRLAPPWTP